MDSCIVYICVNVMNEFCNFDIVLVYSVLSLFVFSVVTLTVFIHSCISLS